jgi:hypothetical protein
MAALFARLWLLRSVTDLVSLSAAKPFRTPNMDVYYFNRHLGVALYQLPVPRVQHQAADQGG